MELHTQYSGRIRIQMVPEGPSRTHQSFRKEVDINNIVKRHTDGRIPLPSAGLVFEDVSALSDYREALDNVTAVRKVFDRLPSSSRGFFDNDAAIFLDWTLHNEPQAVDNLMLGPPQPESPEVSPTPAAVAVEATPDPSPDKPGNTPPTAG